jgi:Flp pilus assembly protein TadD
MAHRTLSASIGAFIRAAVLIASALAASGCSHLVALVPDAQARAEMSRELRRGKLLERQRARDAALQQPAVREEVSIDEYLRRGDRFRASGDVSKAYAAYARAHLTDNDDPEPLRRIAFLALGDAPEEAERLFRELVEETPEAAVLHTGLGMALLAQDDLHGAVAALRTAIALDPDSTAALSTLGVAYDRLGRHEDAHVSLRAARERGPDDVYTLNNLGVSYLLSGAYELAAEALQDAVAIGSDDPTVHNNLGLALGLLGRDDDSFKTFRAAGSIGDAYNNLGYVFFLRGDYDAAIRSYEKALLSDDTDMRRVIRNISRAEWSRDRDRQAPPPAGTRTPPEL